MDQTEMVFALLQNLDEKMTNINDSQIRVEADFKSHSELISNKVKLLTEEQAELEEEIDTKITKPTFAQIGTTFVIIGVMITALFRFGLL